MQIISNNPVLGQILYSSISLLFLVFGAVAVAVSIGLIVRKDSVFRIFETMNGNISTRKGFRQLAILRNTSQQEMKYGHWIAGFIVVGAVYALFGIAALDDTKIATALGLSLPLHFVIWTVESARLTLITLSVFSLMIGIMLGFFPHALSVIEKPLNKWYSMRVLIYELEKMHMGVDRFVAAFPQTVGWVILFPALAVLINSGFMLV